MARSEVMVKFESELKEFKATQTELQKVATNRQKLLTQLNENSLVMKELELAPDDSNIYKMIGPVLVKQSRDEAKAHVQKRVDYIDSEIKRHENLTKDLEKKHNEKRQKVMELQMAIQQGAAKK
jgi:prefoldin beta subunit